MSKNNGAKKIIVVIYAFLFSLGTASVGYGFWTDRLDLEGKADVIISLNVFDDIVDAEAISNGALNLMFDDKNPEEAADKGEPTSNDFRGGQYNNAVKHSQSESNNITDGKEVNDLPQEMVNEDPSEETENNDSSEGAGADESSKGTDAPSVEIGNDDLSDESKGDAIPAENKSNISAGAPEGGNQHIEAEGVLVEGNN